MWGACPPPKDRPSAITGSLDRHALPLTPACAPLSLGQEASGRKGPGVAVSPPQRLPLRQHRPAAPGPGALHPGPAPRGPRPPLASQALPRPHRCWADAPGGSRPFLTATSVGRTRQGCHRAARCPSHRPQPAGQASSSGRGLHPRGPAAEDGTLREKPQGLLNIQQMHSRASSGDRPGATQLVDLT